MLASSGQDGQRGRVAHLGNLNDASLTQELREALTADVVGKVAHIHLGFLRRLHVLPDLLLNLNRWLLLADGIQGLVLRRTTGRGWSHSSCRGRGSGSSVLPSGWDVGPFGTVVVVERKTCIWSGSECAGRRQKKMYTDRDQAQREEEEVVAARLTRPSLQPLLSDLVILLTVFPQSEPRRGVVGEGRRRHGPWLATGALVARLGGQDGRGEA